MIKSLLASVTGSMREALKSSQEQAAELPIFPLGSVLFPGGTMALKIFEQRYFDLAKTCLRTGAPFGIALIREGEEVGMPAVPESVGTLAYILDWDMPTLGVLQVRVRGAERFRILSCLPSENGLIVGQVCTLANDAHCECPEHDACAQFLRKVFAQTGTVGTAGEQRFDDAGWVGFRVTEILPFDSTIKQKILELTDARMRLQILQRFLADQHLLG